jgi:hypothetical protein
MKHLISVPVLVLSFVACSSDPSTDGAGGTTGSSGTTTTTAGTGTTTAGASAGGGGSGSGVAGTPTTGGSSPTAGTTGNTAGAGSTAGSPGTAGTGGTAGAGTGGSMSTGGTAGTGGMPGTSGAGPTASFKCDNLSLAPAMTGVAKPAGAAGGMKVLDWAGFKGAASFTFDDNRPSQLESYAALKATGAHFTWFLIGSSAGDGYKATIADGQEIANHSQTHPDPKGASQNEVTQAKQTLSTKFGVPVVSFAAPNCDGAWTQFSKSAAFLNRGPCAESIGALAPRDATDQYAVPAWLPKDGAPASNMTDAITAGKWRIFVIHGFVNDGGGTYHPVPIASVTGAMSKAVSDGYWVETMGNVGAYWQGQKLIPESATTSAMWTLPANFPANMCLRITTTGGTVKQKGETIAWDPHGYYQISLAAGEVTIE